MTKQMTTEEKIEVFTVGCYCKIKRIDGRSSRYQHFKLEWTKKGATLSDEKKNDYVKDWLLFCDSM